MFRGRILEGGFLVRLLGLMLLLRDGLLIPRANAFLVPEMRDLEMGLVVGILALQSRSCSVMS